VKGYKEEEVSSYLMTLRKRGNTGNWKRKHSVENSLWKGLLTS